MPLDPHDMHTLDAFARGTASSIPHARQLVAALLSEVEAQQQEIARLRAEAESARTTAAERLDRLRTTAAERLDRLRTTAATLVEELGSQGPEDADQVATRAAAEIRRLRAELDAARPGVEWRHLPGSAGWERADVGQFSLLLMGDSAWRVICGDQAVIARGSPGGAAGKAAAYAAYLRACGIAPAIVRLHQRWEGTSACLHCGKPLPWPDMDVCPRVPPPPETATAKKDSPPP